MHFLPFAVFAAAIPKPTAKGSGTAIKLTKDTPFPNPDNIVNVDVLEAHVASLNAKILRSFDYYEKNTGTTHPNAVNGSGMRERGVSSTLMVDGQHTWYGEVSIGTPPQTFSVEIDTGSSDMFVPWYLCDDGCNGHTLWDTGESCTAEPLLTGFSLMYGDGAKVSGMQYVDNVTISGFTADKQTIGVALSYSTQFHLANWAPDGLLGMAFNSLSVYPARPLFETLVEESGDIELVFSIKLTSDGGELYIGGVNPDLYKGEFMYAPVTVQAHWQVEIQSIQDAKGNVLLINVPAIIDTGATYIFGDPIRVSNMYEALGGIYVGRGFYSFPCNSFPTISFSFAGNTLEILPEFLNLGRVSSGSSLCFSSIIAQNMAASFWVIGVPFLRGYYTTFEFGESPRVGFAQLK